MFKRNLKDNMKKLVVVSILALASLTAKASEIELITAICNQVVTLAEKSKYLVEQDNRVLPDVMATLDSANPQVKWLLGAVVPAHMESQQPFGVRSRTSMYRCIGAYYEYKQLN